MSTQPQTGMAATAPPGIGMPPGLSFNGSNGAFAQPPQQSQQQQSPTGQQQQQQPAGAQGPPQQQQPQQAAASLHQLPQQQQSPPHLLPLHQQQSAADLAVLGQHPQLAALLSGMGGAADLQSFAAAQSQFGGNFPPMQPAGGAFGGNFGGYGSQQGSAPPQSSNPCRMHQQGQCRYGATCRFTHIGPAGGGGNSFGGAAFGGGAFGHRGGNQFGQQFGQPSQQQIGDKFQPINMGFMRPMPNIAQSMHQQQHQQQQAQAQASQQMMQMQQQQQQQSSQSQPPQSQSQSPSEKDQLDSSSVGAFNPNVAAFVPVPSPSGGGNVVPPSGPNQALLQALLQQQLLNTASGGAPNADLEALIASLSKMPAPAPVQVAPAVGGATDLNTEFLQAQAQLASLALGASRPPQQQGGFGGPYGGPQRSPPYQGGSNYGGNKYGQSNSYGQQHHPQQSFHAGGNFGQSMSGMPSQQMRFYSDPNNRDQRREMELFGPAHTNTTGINFDKYDDIPVEVTGNDVPGEMKAFSDFDFPEVIRQNIELSKYVKPTPIQKFALPVAFLGRDLMACAQTGSGKTAAFLLPFIAHLVINGRPAPQGGSGRNRRYMPVGLILAPTRELATQIWEESLKFTYTTSIHSVVVYGGQDIRQQFRELDRGCDIVIGTPGRLMDFVERGRISLSQISYLCLDEADRMLDMGFEPQIRNIVMQQDMSENRQTLMFSATFPKEIQRLAQDFLYNYIFIAVGRVGASSDFITQSVDWVDEENKRTHLMQLLPRFKGLTLIFVERKKSADLLETYLNREGYHASSIHGDRSQHEREAALMQFRNGRCPILVATDVAARGLDIPNVLDVVNFDFPGTIDDYVHRIGRTGRAGNTGNAWSFVNEKSNHLFKELFDMLQENKQVVPQWLAAVVESRGGMRSGGGGGGKRFGGKDYRKGGQGYGSHSGGRGGMAQHNLGKRFNSHASGGGGGMMSGQNMFPGGAASAMFPGAFPAGGAMRPNQGGPAHANGFNPLAAAMTGRAFPQAPAPGQFGQMGM